MSDGGGPGPLQKRRSSRIARDAAAPYARPSKGEAAEGAGSSGLTKYMGDTSLDWGSGGKAKKDDDMEDEDQVGELSSQSRTKTMLGSMKSFVPGRGKKKKEADDDDDDDGELQSRSVSTFGRALSSFRQGKKPVPKEIDIWKPSETEVFGLTFEPPADATLKGVVVAEMRPGGLAARSKKLKIGDVVHVVNGRPVTTPQQGAQLLREAKGVVQIVVTRLGAAPKPKEGEEAAAELSKADKTKSSFLPSMSFRPGGKKKAEPDHKTDDPHNTTVVVSCSALIIESKKIGTQLGAIPRNRRNSAQLGALRRNSLTRAPRPAPVGPDGGLDEKLDALYTSLKAKEVSSSQALKTLVSLVGQTTVEQAGLVISNAQSGALPDGWVEYFDKASGRQYYYNVHTKTTTWYKPRKDKPPPPPPPPGAVGGRASKPAEDEEMETENSTSAGHGVASAIADMQTRKAMVDAVQMECSKAPRNGPQGLQSVSL